MNSSEIEETLHTSDDGVKPLLSTILNLNMWKENSEKVITAINKLLGISKTRLKGLEFLNLIISNCSTRVIAENGITWITHCMIKYSGDDLKELKLRTIGRIIDNCYEEQEFSKKFVSEYISKVLEICSSTHNNSHDCEAALDTLAICMKHYGSWFAPHKLRIEKFITTFLDNPSDKVVEKAAIAFHYLQQVGGAGIDGINHKKNFSANFNKLCVTVHTLFDKFFEHETEIDQTDRNNQEAFEFTDFPHYTIQKLLHIMARRITNCVKFIVKMLLKGFPVEKEIKPSDVLDIVSRGTATHRCLSAAKDNSLEDFHFSILLNQIQIELLRLLHVFIVWLQANALPFSFTVTKILTDCLNKTQSCQCFKTDSFYQEMVYKVIGCWIRISRGAVHTHFQMQMMKCILKDVTPVKNSISLSLSSDMLKNKSKKAVQKAVQDKIILSGQGNRMEAITNVEKFNRENNCLFALDTLKHLLIGTILKLHPNTIQELYTCIIRTLIDIQSSETSHPYTNQDCAAKLYEVLVAFYEQDTIKTLPPLQLTIDILNRGINSHNRTIALTCEHGLSILEKLCQPVCPSLFISGDVIKNSELVTDDKIVKNKFEEMEDVDEVEQTSNDGEPDLDTGGNAENGEMQEETEIREENLDILTRKKITEDGSESFPTLVQEPSVHILDVQIIKTSASTMELENMVNAEDSAINSVHDANAVEQIEENRESPSHVAKEILNQNGEEDQEHEELKEPIETDEPPSKKIRTEEEILVMKKEMSQSMEDDTFEKRSMQNTELKANVPAEEPNVLPEVKKEEQDLEDDIFEEGSDFVDVVKDY